MHYLPSTIEKLSSRLSLDWLDRDLSLLAFNTRVLDWAKRTDVPLLERLRYLCIVSSNLDEFFEVRAALYTSLAKPKAALSDVDAQAQASLSQAAHELVHTQYDQTRSTEFYEVYQHALNIAVTMNKTFSYNQRYLNKYI